jgi:hypothetical protein
VLDVQVSPGNEHSSSHAKEGLGALLDELEPSRRPKLVRGDSGYGNEGILLTLESRKQPYLLRLRQTKNVLRLVERQFARSDWSRADNQGCQMIEDRLRLLGWSKERRVAVKPGIATGVAADGFEWDDVPPSPDPLPQLSAAVQRHCETRFFAP